MASALLFWTARSGESVAMLCGRLSSPKGEIHGVKKEASCPQPAQTQASPQSTTDPAARAATSKRPCS